MATGPRSAASPRRRLDRDAVDAAAEAIVDRDGWDALTMSGLARELGVKVPSLYSHVPNLEALLGDLQVRAMRQLASELRNAAMGTVGDRAIRTLAGVLRDFAHRYPDRYQLAMREPIDRHAFTEASTDAAGAFTAIIASFGVEDPPLELMLTCFATLHGVLSLERAGLFRDLIDTDIVYERAVELVVLELEREGRADPLSA